jgi:hypothetical protein
MAKENHRGKKYVASAAGLNRDELYDLTTAVTKVKSMAKAKFDETVDLAVRLGLDTKKSEQTIRGTVSMPSGTGKSVRIAVFAQGDNAKAAREAGADIVGAEDLAADIEKGNMNFDIAIATPDLMPLVGKLGRALGPRGRWVSRLRTYAKLLKTDSVKTPGIGLTRPERNATLGGRSRSAGTKGYPRWWKGDGSIVTKFLALQRNMSCGRR